MSFETFPLETLRARQGAKWARFDSDVIPCWVADMDFPLALPIRHYLASALAREEFGYPHKLVVKQLAAAFSERMAHRFDWHPDPTQISVLVDVVQGIYIAVAQFSEAGDGVVLQTPLYPPFFGAVLEQGREIVRNPLNNNQSGWEVDVNSLAAAITPRTRLLALCNPHNPSGRVFTRRELEGLAELVLRHDLVVMADEIHADLVYDGATHIPFASLSPEIAARTITFTSASKAFNTAGLRVALAHFGSAEMRARFDAFLPRLRGGLTAHAAEVNCIAWRECGDWLAEALAYLEGNRDLVTRFVAEQLPGVRHHRPQATYLSWLDFRDSGLDEDPHAFFLREAKVGLSEGPPFGLPEGRHAARLNFATDRELLVTILERMATAYRAR